MHRVFIRDGLKQSLLSWSTQSVLSPRFYRTRTSIARGRDHGDQSHDKAVAGHAASEATEPVTHGRPVPEHQSLAPGDGQHEASNASQASGYAAHGSPQFSTPSTQSESHEPSPKETIDKSHGRKGPKYRRHIPRPKRFPPLLAEIKKHGLKENASRPTNSLDRSVVSTPTLKEELRWVAQTNPHPKSIRNTLELLIRDRKEKPDSEYYRVLILGNCFPELGSVDNVKTILQEMEREGIPIDSDVCHAVLEVRSSCIFHAFQTDTNPRS